MTRLLLLSSLIFWSVFAHAAGDWQRLDADEPAPGFTFTDQDGRRVALDDFRGKAVLLSFMYTECKDICPVLPQIMARADQWLSDDERRRVRFVGISLDPRRDTPQKLAAFMKTHNLAAPRWTLLTGTLAEATRAAGDYGIVARPDAQGEIAHNAVFVLIDPKGRLRSEFHGLASPSQEIAQTLRTLIARK